MSKIISLKNYKINKIRKQMIKEYSKYPIVGNYKFGLEILNPKISRLMQRAMLEGFMIISLLVKYGMK